MQYKTEDLTPVYWYHYTPDALVVPDASPFKSFADFVKAAKAEPASINLGGSALNSANHAAHERLDAAFGIKTTYVPYKGTGDLANRGARRPDQRRDDLHAFAINNKGRVRPLAVAMDRAIRCCPTCRPSRSSASTGSTAPTAASACRRRRRPTRRSACRTCSRR